MNAKVSPWVAAIVIVALLCVTGLAATDHDSEAVLALLVGLIGAGIFGKLDANGKEIAAVNNAVNHVPVGSRPLVQVIADLEGRVIAQDANSLTVLAAANEMRDAVRTIDHRVTLLANRFDEHAAAAESKPRRTLRKKAS